MGEINHEFLTRNNSDENIRFEYPAETVRGEKGEPATIRVGEVAVSDDGTAEVTNTGTESDVVLNFTVPKGDKGDTGKAATVRIGDVTVSDDGTAEVTNTGTESDAVLNFTVPKGDKGEKGDPLKVGEVTAQKLAPEAPATAEITQEENVLNFTFGIPKGEKGNTGVQGKSGLNAKILAETKTTTGTEAKAEVVLVDPETNEYELHLTIPKGDKGDTAPAPEVEIKKLEWVESPEDAAVNVTLDESGKYFVDIKAPHWRGDKGEKGDGFHYVGRFDSVDAFPPHPDMLDTAVATIDGKDVLYVFDGSQWQEAATLTGAKGEDGKSIKFVGYFDGVEDLITKIPTPELNNMAVVTKDEGARHLALYTGNDWHDLAKISGDKGEKGETGTPATVKIGDVTVSDDGTAEVTNTGTESDAVLNFTVPKGDKGEKGETGTPATVKIGDVTVSDDGTAEVTNTGTESDAVLNFTVPKGDKGEKGETGTPATVKIGDVTVSDDGTAEVTNTGTESDAVLNFTVPKGDKGEKGETGTPATVKIGDVTVSDDGTAEVTNTGTESDAVLNFTVPKGDKGEKGEPVTIRVGEVTTADAGTEASVVNAGSDNNVVLNFTIPKGDRGRQGPQGVPGAYGRPSTIKIGEVATSNDATEVTVENTGNDANAILNFTFPKNKSGVKYHFFYVPRGGNVVTLDENYYPVKVMRVSESETNDLLNGKSVEHPLTISQLADVIGRAEEISSEKYKVNIKSPSLESNGAIFEIEFTDGLSTDYVYIVMCQPLDVEVTSNSGFTVLLGEID